MKKYIGLSIIALSLGLTSCNDWLDKLPDNRMELKTPEDITDLLTSAYPETHPAYLLEMYSDNADLCDNNGWDEADRFQRQAWQWDDITEIRNNESPQELWNKHYSAVAAANAAIEYIDGLDLVEASQYSAQLGEALLCRAYAMFQLSTVFCNAYDPSTANTEKGLPYPTATERKVGEVYERGTLAELYENIDADIQRALPLVKNAYSHPKFHFTPNAAFAFAARFYLNYQKYEKTIDYANRVLGDNPTIVLRDWAAYDALQPNGQIQPEFYISSDNRANLLIQSVYSQWGAIGGPYQHLGDKYAHGNRISNDETMQSTGPWGNSTDFRYTVWYNRSLSKYIFRKVPYEFEYTDVQARIGYAHAIYCPFTTDILLLERAEAYALLGNTQSAVNDINAELSVFHRESPVLTAESITEFYNSIDYYIPKAYTTTLKDKNGNVVKDENGLEVKVTHGPTPKKHLHPTFDIGKEGETKECLLQCILHLRRILTLHEGLRMQDVKRYGIVVYRRTMNANFDITNVTDSLTVKDPRRAIQIPQDVITAGLEGNTRVQTSNQEGNIVNMVIAPKKDQFK